MREAHCHLLALGQALTTASLADCASMAECLQRIAQLASGLTSEQSSNGASKRWIKMAQAHHNNWPEARWPTAAELDAAAGQHPCIIKSFDHHHAVCNSAALHAAGLVVGQTVPPLGRVVADAAGTFTGELVEHAAWHIWQADGEPTPTERLSILRAACDHLAAFGYREAHDMLSQSWLPNDLTSLALQGHLPLKVLLYAEPTIAEQLLSERTTWHPHVKLGGMKLFADGTLSARTAHMVHRYADPLPDASRGRCMTAPAAILATMQRCQSLGIGLAVHAIGDGAVKTVLDCAERARTATPAIPAIPAGAASGPKHGLDACRIRIEHAEIIDKPDVVRFAELRIDCSVQPCHLPWDIAVIRKHLPHRTERVMPLAELLAAGLVPGSLGADGLWAGATPQEIAAVPAGLAFGSDAPIVGADPQDSLFAAVNRRAPHQPTDEALGLPQAVNLTQARQCFGN